MTIGSWTPESEKAALEIDGNWLLQCVALSTDEALQALPKPFSDAELSRYSTFMRFSPEAWKTAVEPLESDQLKALIRFFTVAEMRISGWDAGAESPAIWINKVLRSRGEKLSKDELLWIRANSDNRFIPNGGL
jgi:hypothetical protein